MIKTTEAPPNVIVMMQPDEVEHLLASTRGYRLYALLDAARDVARQSDREDLRRAAERIVTSGKRIHPEYWDPTLRGVG